MIGDIQITRFILTKRRNGKTRLSKKSRLPRAANFPEPPHSAAAKIAIEIQPLHVAVARAAIDIAARDRAANVMSIVGHWRRIRRWRNTARCGRVARRPFENIPAIIGATSSPPLLEIDFLPSTLPDVCDVKITSKTVEGKTPGIAQAKCP